MTPDIGLGLILALFGSVLIFCMIMNYDFMFQSTRPGDRKFNALVQMFGREYGSHYVFRARCDVDNSWYPWCHRNR